MTKNYPREIFERYWAFYRAQPRRRGYSSAGCVKPLKLAVDILQRNPELSDEELRDSIAASIMKFMAQCHAGTAEGRYVLSGEAEVEAVREFARFFVDEYFRGALRGDHARISGNKLSILEHTCEFLYRLREDEERAQKKSVALP